MDGMAWASQSAPLPPRLAFHARCYVGRPGAAWVAGRMEGAGSEVGPAHFVVATAHGNVGVRFDEMGVSIGRTTGL